MQASKLLSLFAFTFLGACSTHSAHDGTAKVEAGTNPFSSSPEMNVGSYAQQKGYQTLRIAFSGNVNGETEPCGCAVNPKGGLDRRLNFIRREKERSSTPLLVVDAGNALFAAKTLEPSQDAFLRARAELVMKGHHMMGIEVQNVGHLDLSGGVDFLKKTASDNHVHLVSLNWVDSSGKPLFETEYTTQVGGMKVLVLGVSRGSDGPLPQGVSLIDPETALRVKLHQIPKDQAVVVLSDMGNQQDREFAAQIDRPMIFVGSRDLSSLEIPIHEKGSVIVQGQLQGQQWGVAEFAWNPNAQGWYNLALRENFAKRWDSIVEERKSTLREPASEDRASELEHLTDASADMLRYSAQNLDQKGVYDYHLYDMTIEFAKPNELTPLMAKLSDPSSYHVKRSAR